jgi:GntR family transcriptional regulator
MSVQRPQPLYEQIAEALRADIRSGRYGLGAKLPSESELSERFKVSKVTARQAVIQLRMEGLVSSRVGAGVFVEKAPGPPRRLSDDVLRGEALYRAMDRLGLQPAITTTIDRAPADAEVAEALDVPPGAEVLVHVRLVRAVGGPPIFLASNYFPLWVLKDVPQLAEPSTVGLPKHLGERYGPMYGIDWLDARMPTSAEREQLEVPPDTPVTVIEGTNYDSQHRALHHIHKVTVAGRMQYGYRFGVVVED